MRWRRCEIRSLHPPMSSRLSHRCHPLAVILYSLEICAALAADGHPLIRVKEYCRVPTPGNINAIALCDTGKICVAGGQDQVVHLWCIDKRMNRTCAPRDSNLRILCGQHDA